MCLREINAELFIPAQPLHVCSTVTACRHCTATNWSTLTNLSLVIIYLISKAYATFTASKSWVKSSISTPDLLFSLQFCLYFTCAKPSHFSLKQNPLRTTYCSHLFRFSLCWNMHSLTVQPRLKASLSVVYFYQ